jgi:hypothetical protein
MYLRNDLHPLASLCFDHAPPPAANGCILFRKEVIPIQVFLAEMCWVYGGGTIGMELSTEGHEPLPPLGLASQEHGKNVEELE